MRDIFEDIFEKEPLDPMAATRRAMRSPRRARFYQRVSVGEGGDGDGFTVLLDGKPVRTPARHPLIAPVRALADALTGEWDAQRERIDPAAMPLTRLANAVIDRVSAAPAPVRAEIERYLGSDMLFYRAPARMDCWRDRRRTGTRCWTGPGRRSVRASCWPRASPMWRSRSRRLRRLRRRSRARAAPHASFGGWARSTSSPR